MTKFETKIQKLGIADEVNSIIENCECGEITSYDIIEISKLRKWEVQEEIGNFLNPEKYGSDFCCENKRMSTFLKAFDITENEIADMYASALCEGGAVIAYAVTDDVILVLE